MALIYTCVPSLGDLFSYHLWSLHWNLMKWIKKIKDNNNSIFTHKKKSFIVYFLFFKKVSKKESKNKFEDENCHYHINSISLTVMQHELILVEIRRY